MKKCLAYLAILSLLLSLGTVFAAAELPSVSFQTAPPANPMCGTRPVPCPVSM